MQIVIDGRMILAHMTGVGRYLLDLIPVLRETAPDLELELWLQKSLPAGHPAWQLGGERLHLRPISYRHMSLGGQFAIPAELAGAHPDLYHYPHFDLPWFVSGAAVATIHDLKYIARPDFFPRRGRAKRLAMRVMMAHTCRRARQVIVVSLSTAQDLNGYLGVPLSKLHVAPHGVNQRFFQRLPPQTLDDLRHRYNLADSYVLFVGERRPHKNITGLIEAFAIFRRMAPRPYQLVIAGKRYADYQIPEKIVEEIGLQDYVRFIDHPPDADLPALYQAADALALLSYYEGFGLPVLEAMASGTPVVTADRTSLPEVTGNAGLLVPPDAPEQAAQALNSIVPGGMLRQEYISAGLEHARQFTWQRCAGQTLEVYRKATKEL